MRFERQHDLLSQEKLAEQRILIIGVGAVGRQVAISLAAMGAKNIRICDMDIVDESNIATQAYPSQDVGQKKVVSLIKTMRSLDHEANSSFMEDEEAWNPRRYIEYNPTIVFSCVDRMDVRRSIFLFCKKNGTPLFLDGRMLAEMGHVFCYDSTDIDGYESTLFTDEQALQGRCTARGTLYMANILANLMVGKMSLSLRGLKDSNKYTYNIVGELM